MSKEGIIQGDMMGQEEDQNHNRIHNEIWVTYNVTIAVRMVMCEVQTNEGGLEEIKR